MKYPICKDPQIKAKVALRALKGEYISYLSATYHVNRWEITEWKRQLLHAIHLEDWMVKLFATEPCFLKKDKNEEF